MRNLIPRLQVVVARDRSRAERVLADLTPGQEVFLAPLTNELIKVSDRAAPESAHVLGVVPAEWSGRIKDTEASGRKCRAWFVSDLPPEKSPDGSFRMVLTVWCSSLSSPSGWRELSVDELLGAALRADDVVPRSATAGPFRPSRLFEPPPAVPTVPPSGHDAPPPRADASGLPADRAERSGLSAAQMDLIKEAVRRKLASKAD